jgi:hypothetical protein
MPEGLAWGQARQRSAGHRRGGRTGQVPGKKWSGLKPYDIGLSGIFSTARGLVPLYALCMAFTFTDGG